VRIWLLFGALTACGGKPATTAPPSNNAAPPEPVKAADADGPEDCAGEVESSKPGNHDRYAFEAPDGSYGFKTKAGAVAIAPRFKYAYEFKPTGIAAAVDSDASFVYIDTSGKVIARAYAFDNGPDYFQEGHARIVDDKKKVGFISERGVITIAPRFEEAASFCHGKASVRENGQELWIDKSGKPTTPPAESAVPAPQE
jgi:hypothetical protein